MAAWLTVRGRDFVGSRELMAFDTWSDRISWRDYKGHHESRHRPDLVGIRADGRPVAFEVELAQKSVERLRPILHRHAVWRASGRTNGVWYVCEDEDGCARIKKVAAKAGYFRDGAGLVLELLATIEARAIEMREADPRAVGFRRPASHAVGDGG
jgi:hypothetical protein